MTEQEWAEFAGRLEATFRGGLQDDREHELRRHFGIVPFDVAVRCIDRLVQGVEDGHGLYATEPQVYMPTAAELMRALKRVTGGGWEMKVMLSGKTSAELLAESYGPARPALTEGTP